MHRKPVLWLIGSVTLALLAATLIDLTRAATRPALPPLRITEVSPAVAPTGEWVRISNAGRRAVALSGWSITGPTRHSYAMSGSIAPGAAVVVHTGAGRDDQPPGHRYQRVTPPLWDARADSVILRAPSGATAHVCTWHPGARPPCAPVS